MKKKATRFQAGAELLETRDVPSSLGLAHRARWNPSPERRLHPPPAIRDRLPATEALARSQDSPRIVHASAAGHPARSAAGPRSAMRQGEAPIALDTKRGARLLEGSTARRGFLALASNYTTQVSETYCSIASTTMVLNASGIDRPVSTEDPYYHYFDQRNILSERVKGTIDLDDVRIRGMTLDTYGRFIGNFPVKSRVIHADGMTLAEFRRTAARTLRSPRAFLVANYQRQEIGQETGGHFSPVAAYNARTDRFLIMDVSRYAYPPVWVPAARLWRGMKAVDSDSGLSRGFAIIETPPAPG